MFPRYKTTQIMVHEWNDESALCKNSPVLLMHHDPSELGSVILIRLIRKKRILKLSQASLSLQFTRLGELKTGLSCLSRFVRSASLNEKEVPGATATGLRKISLFRSMSESHEEPAPSTPVKSPASKHKPG